MAAAAPRAHHHFSLHLHHHHHRPPSPQPPQLPPPHVHEHDNNSNNHLNASPDSALTFSSPPRVAFTSSTSFAWLHATLAPFPYQPSLPLLVPTRALSACASAASDDSQRPSRSPSPIPPPLPPAVGALSHAVCHASSPSLLPPPRHPVPPPLVVSSGSSSSVSVSSTPQSLSPAPSPRRPPHSLSSLLLGVPFHHASPAHADAPVLQHAWPEKKQEEEADEQAGEDWLRKEVPGKERKEGQPLQQWRLDSDDNDELQPGLPSSAWQERKEEEEHSRQETVKSSPAPPPLPVRPPRPPAFHLPVPSRPAASLAPVSPPPPPASPVLSPLSPPPLSSFSSSGPVHLFPPLPSIPPWSSRHADSLLHRQGSSAPPLLVETVHPPSALSLTPSLPAHPHLSSAAPERAYLRVLLPTLSSSQLEHSLCCRQKSSERKWRFSSSPDRLTKRGNDAYCGKLKLLPMTGEGSIFAYDLSDEKGQLVGHIVAQHSRQQQQQPESEWSVWMELLGDKTNEVEEGRAGRMLVGGERLTRPAEQQEAGGATTQGGEGQPHEERRLLSLRVESSGRTVLICDAMTDGKGGGDVDAHRRCLTVDYPLSIFLGFAIVCAVEFSRSMRKERDAERVLQAPHTHGILHSLHSIHSLHG